MSRRPKRAREVLASTLYAIEGGESWSEITYSYQDQFRKDADTLLKALRDADLVVVERQGGSGAS